MDVADDVGGARQRGGVGLAEGERLLSGWASDQPVDADSLPNKRVLLLLAEGFDDAEAACALDVLGWTRYRPSVATVDVDVAAFKGQVSGAFGTVIRADVLVDDVDPGCYDALVVPGGFHNLGYGEVYDERVYRIIRHMRDRGCPIATMCVGVVPVAEAGVLAGGRATTYPFSSRHDNVGRLRDLGCDPVADSVAEWDGVISCSGPAYSERVMHLLLERVAGKAAAGEVQAFRSGQRNS